jgi:ABC-type multidrug transport system ATPase subunit
MSTALVQGAALGQVRGVDLTLSGGRYVVLSNEQEPLKDLIDLLAGRRGPSSGRVLLDGVAPVSSAATRRQVAALFADETLAPAASVTASVALALTARGSAPESASRVLEASGLAHLAQRAPRALGQRETRSVALALALAHDGGQLFAFHEPLTTLVPSSHVLEQLDRHTARGAIVLAATSSSADANALGGAWLCLELGRLRAAAGGSPRLGAGPWQQLLVEAVDAQALATLLHESPLGLTTAPVSATQLKVSGPTLDETVREIAQLARQHGIELTRIEPALPPVEALMAARAGFARGAYEASRLAAQESVRAPSVPPYAGGAA